MPKKIAGDADDRLTFRHETLALLCGLALFALSWAPTIAILALEKSPQSEEATLWQGRMTSLAIAAIIALPAPCLYGALLCFRVRVVTALCVAIPYTGVVWVVTILVFVATYGFSV
ncbi:MAG: hypothetical protein ACREJD_14880 [Phycisphaerales bacterium]